MLSAAIVRVLSPALMTGEERTTSNDKGQWRFPVLPPGQYELLVELPPKFKPYRQDGLIMGAGQILERPVVLELIGLAESVTVEASSIASSRTTGLETRFGPDYIRTVPTRRFSMFDLIRSSPGVSPTSPASGTTQHRVHVFGSAVNENAFLIDGTNFTCPCQGVSRAEPIVDVIQEMHVQSMGASVEYRNIQGGVFNVVTKQGGARLAAESSYWLSPPASPRSRSKSPWAHCFFRLRARHATGISRRALGGPVKRDRVWFFGAYQYIHDYDTQPGANPTLPRTYEQDKFFGKVTWRPTSSHAGDAQLSSRGLVDPTASRHSRLRSSTTQRVEGLGSEHDLRKSHTCDIRCTMWEARAGRGSP